MSARERETTGKVAGSWQERSEEETLICDNGGTVTVRLFWVAAGLLSSQVGFEYRFEDCQSGDMLFDGQVEKYGGRWGGTYVHSSGITVTDPSGSIRYSGSVIDEPGASAMTASGQVSLRQTIGDGLQYSLTDADFHFQHGYSPFAVFATVTLSGGFSLASAQFSGATLRAEITDPLTHPIVQDSETFDFEVLPDDWTFTQGPLRINALDGTALVLEADNGDDQTVTLTLTTSDGHESSWMEDWSVWQANLRIDRE